MRSIKYWLSLASFLFILGCNDEFMDRFPTDAITENNFWNNANELQQYVNLLYQTSDALEGHGIAHAMSQLLTGDNQSDNLVPVDYNMIAAGEHVVPATGGGWNWNFIRSCNYFLNRYNRTPIPQSEKDVYAGEVKVFRALEYFKMVKRFGDVPWLSKDLNSDSEELYRSRDSRILVADSMLADLDWAISKLQPPNKTEAGRINRDVALAFKARICQHEGTFRKYHGIAGAEKFLQQALGASNTLISEGRYRLFNTGKPQSDYAAVFSSLDLTGNPEMILFRKYVIDLLGNRTVQFVHDNDMSVGASKSLVDTYLADDGLPISLSPRFSGHQSIESELTNRDPRLTQTIVFPRTHMQKGFPGPAIPGTDFSSSSLSAGFTPTGYQVLKYWIDNLEEYLRIQRGVLDAPLIRYAEILLIHAEAAAELGTIDQNLLDKTINVLRARAGMPALILSQVENWGADPDYKLDYKNIASPLINEIRRERRVELAIENFRYDDLMRWKEGKLLEEKVRGMQFNQNTYPKVVVGKDIFLDEQGFIVPYAKSLPNGRTFNESKHYYFPLPTEELVLNPNLKQNSGW